MGRKKKPGKRARGIQSKKGHLYIIHTKHVIENGVKVSKNTWEATGLLDTPDNVQKAIELRNKSKNKNSAIVFNRNVTLEEFIKAYTDRLKRSIRDTTYSTYMYAGNSSINYFGSTKIRDISTEMVEAYYDWLFDERHLAPRTVEDYSKFLKRVLRIAVKEGILSTNPAENATINAELKAIYTIDKDPDDTFFSYGELIHFFELAREYDLYEFFILVVYCGLRREEALGVRWSAVHLNQDNPTITIHHTVTRGTKINRTNAAKTDDSIRTYPLSNTMVLLFRHLKQKEICNRRLFGDNYIDNDYIFKNADGSFFYPDHPTKVFKQIIEKNPELPQDITLHGLRISCVSLLVHLGKDVKVIQKWVGHKDIDTTLKIYARVKAKEAKEQVATTMDEILPYDPK